MPTVELSDSQIALLELAEKIGGMEGIQQRDKAFHLHNTLYTHKDTATSYQAAIKKAFPEARVASDLAEPYVAQIKSEFDPVMERFTKFIDTYEADKKAAEESKLQGDFDSRWSGVVKDYSLSSEGEEKLLSFMKDRKNADPEAAAALYFKQNPIPAAPIAPSAISPSSWSKDMGLGPAGEDADLKLLHTDPERFAEQEAAAVLTEIRRAA